MRATSNKQASREKGTRKMLAASRQVSEIMINRDEEK
jgi:hypothetical protein